jgi:hypothetical protein
MTEREQQLEHALSLIVMTNQAVSILRRKHGNKAAEDRTRTVVREFNLAIEHARELLAQRREQTPAGVSASDGETFCGQPPVLRRPGEVA